MTNSNPTPDSDAEYTQVPLELLDEPSNAARETMDEVALAELADSILDHGLIHPLVVERDGDRFRVVAGHRRLLACRLVKLDTVPCLVRNQGEVDAAAVTLAENYYREQVNAAEEAGFLDRLLDERCHGDVDELARLVRRRREYVEDRLLLRRGDGRVLEAVAERKIPLAVARELNRVHDPDQRNLYLDAAVRGGATAEVVKRWRKQGEVVEEYMAKQGQGNAGGKTAAAIPLEQQMRCVFCEDTDEPHQMEMIFVHRHCKKYLARILDRGVTPET